MTTFFTYKSWWNVQLISSIHGSKNMQVQYQSEGRYTASSSLIHGAGVWIVSGTFGGVVVPMNMTGSSSSTSQSATVVVRLNRSGVQTPSLFLAHCPSSMSCSKCSQLLGPKMTIGFVFTLVVISFSPSARVTDCSKNKLSVFSFYIITITIQVQGNSLLHSLM